MPASPASQITMKNGMAAQSCTAIIESGASTASASQRISVMPQRPPISHVITPFGCSSTRQITATTTIGGSTGRKNAALTMSRPRNAWSNSSAASSESIHTGSVAPATNISVLRSAVRNSWSDSRLAKLSNPTHSGGLSRS